MTATAPYPGGCVCGEVRFELERDPMFVHGCHCTWCQRETGAAFAVNALIEIDHVRLTAGSVDTVETPSSSGRGQRIVRCPSCRVAIYSHYSMSGIGEKVAFVRVGTLDDPARWPPDIHIFTSTRQRWLPLPEGVPASETYYKASELWPQESLARRARLFEESS